MFQSHPGAGRRPKSAGIPASELWPQACAQTSHTQVPPCPLPRGRQCRRTGGLKSPGGSRSGHFNGKSGVTIWKKPSIWSVARGLARKVEDYKRGLAECDRLRRNDLDGRGHLSEEALARFTRFFLEICLDQISFIEGLVEPERLRTRILLWAEEEVRLGLLPAKAASVLEALLYRGELPRGEAGPALGITDRHARRIVAALMAKNVLVSESSRAPLRLAFPAALASRWMPGLFPEKLDS